MVSGVHTGRGYISVLRHIVFGSLSSLGKQFSNDLVKGVLLLCQITQKGHGLSYLILGELLTMHMILPLFFPYQVLEGFDNR